MDNNIIRLNHGFIDKDRKTYFKDATTKHFMIKFQGFGISQKILDCCVDEKIETVIIVYRNKVLDEHYIVYESKLSQWIESMKTHTFNTIDVQKFVSVKDMIKKEEKK